MGQRAEGKEPCHVQVTEHLPDPARHPRRRSRHHGAGLAPGHGARPGHPVRRVRVHRRRPGGHAGVQQPRRGARVRAPAPRAGGPRRRSGRPGLARAHRSRARADRRHLGGHRRRRGDRCRLRRRRAGRNAGAVHPRRAGVDRVRRGAVRPPGRGRDHPGAAVRPVQPGLRRPDARAGHRAAPDRQRPSAPPSRQRKRRRPDPMARPSQADGNSDARGSGRPGGCTDPPRAAATENESTDNPEESR